MLSYILVVLWCKTCLFASRLNVISGRSRRHQTWGFLDVEVEVVGGSREGCFSYLLILTIRYAVLSMYTIGNRTSLGDAFLNRQIFFGRASVSTFLYYNIYGTVSTFSRSPCGWEVLLFVVPFAVLPGHSLGCLQYLCIQEESRPSILFIFASTYASTVSPRTPDTLLNAMARMVTTTHLPVSLQER
jgi:hypothetical protein